MKLLVIVSCLLYVSVSSVSSSQFTVNEEKLRNLLLVGKNVLAGSERNLYRLDYQNLTLKQSVELSRINRLLLKLNDTGSSGDVLSCQNDTCSLFSSDDLTTKIPVTIPNNNPTAPNSLIPGEEDLVGIIAIDQSFYVARENLVGNEDIPSAISRIAYVTVDNNLELSLSLKLSEGSIFTERKFLVTFGENDFVYVVYELSEENKAVDRLRIGRVCKNDTGNGGDTISTYTEAKLECEGGSASSSASVVTIDGYLMVLVAENSGSGSTNNVICSFNVSEINQAMNDKLNCCKNGEGKIDLERQGTKGGGCPTMLSQSQKEVRKLLSYLSTLRIYENIYIVMDNYSEFILDHYAMQSSRYCCTSPGCRYSNKWKKYIVV